MTLRILLLTRRHLGLWGTRTPRRCAARGFTLAELMVALTGGLVVSMVVFALARDGSRFYHRESRIAEATLGNLLGFDRLRNDIARAGFLSSPNIAQDGAYCGTVTQLNAFAQLQQLASIQITADGASTTNSVLLSASPPITPQTILLSGAYDSVERFDAVAVYQEGTQYAVRLQTLRGALFRMNYSSLSATAQQALLARLFPPRRALRLVSADSGTFQIGVIVSTGFDATNTPTIYLALNAPLILSGATATRCNASTHQLVNVVNFIRYSLRVVRGDTTPDFLSFQALFDTSGNLPGEDSRLELVRQELDVNGLPVPNTSEVVAEYAVDLRFATTNLDPATNRLATSNFDSANVLTIAGPTIASNPQARPQSIRSIRARLSVRSREADRDANVDTTGPNIAPGLYRIGLGDKGSAPFARVRTLQADTLIGSHSEVTW